MGFCHPNQADYMSIYIYNALCPSLGVGLKVLDDAYQPRIVDGFISWLTEEYDVGALLLRVLHN